jgi:hypothetical protein
MLCPRCFGKGRAIKQLTIEHEFEMITVIDHHDIELVCEECGGKGVIGCCDGLIANE